MDWHDWFTDYFLHNWAVAQMKTLDEVITGLDICKNFSYCTHPQKGECPYLYEDNTCDQDGLYRDALHYLKEYREEYKALIKTINEAIDVEMKYYHMIEELEHNSPLTWDELRTMEGRPIWIEKSQDGEIKGWLLVLRTNADVVTCTTKYGNNFYLYKSLYGEKWKAYKKEQFNTEYEDIPIEYFENGGI